MVRASVANPAPPGVVIINGIALPFVNQTSMPAGYGPGSADGAYALGPLGSPKPAPEGDLVAPRAGPIGGLTQDEVQGIVNAAVAEANLTRAVIRLPIGSRARMVIAVSDLDGTHHRAASHGRRDGVQHRRRGGEIAQRDLLQRTESHGQRSAGSADGHRGDQPHHRLRRAADLSAGHRRHRAWSIFPALSIRHPAIPARKARRRANPNQNGIVFFPGSLPLYRNGVLVGGLGVSGDGVDQDDFVTSAGAAGFDAPTNIQADQIIDQGVRLPYLKFPQNPTY